jgi:hypothetical protein
MQSRYWALALSSLLVFGGNLLADKAKPAKADSAFGTLQSATPEEARAQAQAWLKSQGKSDATTTKAFESIWADKESTLIEKVTDTLTLGDPTAKQLLADAGSAKASAPTKVPAVLKDAKKPAFFRANLALAYAKALTKRRVYEEALDALKAVKAEQVTDPSAYFFTRAVAAHALMQRTEADNSIVRLLDDVADAPERYKMVATLMHFDMTAWQDKDLGWIARKMDNIERRLDLSRGGPKTQKMQKEVVMRLDELIKELENKNKGNGNDGNCPNGGKPGMGGGQGPTPMSDSNRASNSGPGRVDPKRVKQLAEQWGKLPEKERAKALLDLTRDMPPRYREVIESYFKKISDSGSK